MAVAGTVQPNQNMASVDLRQESNTSALPIPGSSSASRSKIYIPYLSHFRHLDCTRLMLRHIPKLSLTSGTCFSMCGGRPTHKPTIFLKLEPPSAEQMECEAPLHSATASAAYRIVWEDVACVRASLTP